MRRLLVRPDVLPEELGADHLAVGDVAAAAQDVGARIDELSHELQVPVEEVPHHLPVEDGICQRVDEQLVDLPVVDRDEIERALDPRRHDTVVTDNLPGLPDVTRIHGPERGLEPPHQVEILPRPDRELDDRGLGVPLVHPANLFDPVQRATRGADRCPCRGVPARGLRPGGDRPVRRGGAIGIVRDGAVAVHAVQPVVRVDLGRPRHAVHVVGTEELLHVVDVDERGDGNAVGRLLAQRAQESLADRGAAHGVFPRVHTVGPPTAPVNG